MPDHELEIREHGKDIARLKSDVFNLDEMVRKDMRSQLLKVQAGIDEIKGLIGDGNVMFAQLVAKDEAQQKDIVAVNQRVDVMEAERSNRWISLIYPIIIGAVLVVLGLIGNHIFFK